jgi:hypothetical protein
MVPLTAAIVAAACVSLLPLDSLLSSIHTLSFHFHVLSLGPPLSAPLLHCSLLCFVFHLLSLSFDFASLCPCHSLLLQGQLDMPCVVWVHIPSRSLAIRTVVHILVGCI